MSRTREEITADIDAWHRNIGRFNPTISERDEFDRLQRELMSLTQQQDVGEDGWLPWHGGPQPVADNVVVEVRFRDGIEVSEMSAAFWSYPRSSWKHKLSDRNHDIIAYRIVSPAPPQHDLYKTGDADAPEAIKDRNSEVVLGLCRRCGRGEVELSEPCDAPPQPALDVRDHAADTIFDWFDHQQIRNRVVSRDDAAHVVNALAATGLLADPAAFAALKRELLQLLRFKQENQEMHEAIVRDMESALAAERQRTRELQDKLNECQEHQNYLVFAGNGNAHIASKHRERAERLATCLREAWAILDGTKLRSPALTDFRAAHMAVLGEKEAG
jgi:hypothetical protein